MARFWRTAHVGCIHDSKDLQFGLLSRYHAMRAIEKYGANSIFDGGDAFGGQGFPDDEAGKNTAWQERAGLQSIRPEDVFAVAGNHDRGPEPGSDCLDWFAKYRDPFCEHTETSGRDPKYQRIKPTGALEAYEVQIGNIIFLCLSDVNRFATPRTEERGGDPGGVVTPQQYQWWKDRCAHYRGTGAIVVTVAHYAPFNTTSGTGEYEGGVILPDGTYDGIYNQKGITNGRGSSFLCFVGDQFGYPFVEHLAEHPGDCDVWFHNHLHIPHGVRVGGKGHIETVHGCTFINAGHISRKHHGDLSNAAPKHRVAVWFDGEDTMTLESIMHEPWGKFTAGLWSTRAVGLNGKRVRL